jgi:hypothetical protein
MAELNSRTSITRAPVPLPAGTLRHALYYAANGFPVFPLHGVSVNNGVVTCGCYLGKDCERPGKHPANRHGLLEATTDAFEVRGAWNAAAFEARREGRDPIPPSIGVRTGSHANNLVVFDIDPKPPKGRPESGVEWGWGYSSFRALEAEVGVPLPETLAVVTGSGGRHLWTRSSGPTRSCNGFRESLDVKAEGGYVVVPPSLHRSGSKYVFVPPLDFGRIAALPPEWEAAIQERAPSTTVHSGRPARRVGLHRARIPVGTAKALLVAMLAHPLVDWAAQNADDVSREVWRGIATNFAALSLECPEVRETARRAFHAVSEEYSGYTPGETDRVFADAVRSAEKYGPMTFKHMADSGAPDEACAGATSLIHAARKTTTLH